MMQVWDDKIFQWNGYIITWILNQIFKFSNTVILAAGYNNDTLHPLPNYWMNKLTNKRVPC